MYNSFIPNYHYRPSDEKLTSEWFGEAMKDCWYNGNPKSLLWGKNLHEIREYAVGDYSMKPYKLMFKSQRTALSHENQDAINRGEGNVHTHDIPVDGFVPTPLINVKLNSARALVNKIPFEVSITAQDPLAVKKKKEDLTFLKNKPVLEADLQEVADQLQVGKVDLGTTRHSAVPYSDSPYGLDLSDPEEEDIFANLFYNLGVEAALESGLNQFADIKNVEQIRSLETKDQFYYGVSSNFCFESAVTNLPDAEYAFPGDCLTPYSQLPDFSDNPYRFFNKRATVMDLLNYSDDLCKDDLENVINNKETGYCACNDRPTVDAKDFSSAKVELVFCMIKSIDFVGIAPLNKKSKFTYIVTDPEQAKNCTTKIYGQNTYCAWWLKNTKYYFGIHKLSYAHRTVGQESFQGFPLNIFKSQEKSAVELSIGENKKAQIADIKMQHAILTSLPAGKYIDLKFLRGALGGLKEGADKYTLQSLLNLAMERNYVIGDTEGFEGKNDGQFKPVIDIPGGLKTEIMGYMQVIADANSKISQYTGINENLIGQKSEELVRNNNALINAGINALDYVSKAIAAQYQKLFTCWANILKGSIEKGGKTKEAVINLIGIKQTNLIDALGDLPLHTMGIKVELNQNQEWVTRFNQEVNKNEITGILNSVDIYMLEGIKNTKQKFGFMAVKIRQWEKRTELKRQQDMAQQQAMLQAQGQNQVAAVNAKVQGDIQKIYAQGDTSSKILQLASQLGIQSDQMSFIGKRALQNDRGTDQTNKAVSTIQAKAEADNQSAYK